MLKKRTKRILIGCIIIIFLLGAGFIFMRFDAGFFHVFYNNDAACANCLGQVGLSMRMYSNKYDENFPAGKEKPLDSLALLAEEGFLEAMHCYTSHALGQKLSQYYKKHKKIPEKLCCYRYNEGLTESAPCDSVLMYYYKPIKWCCYMHPMKENGRMILFVDGHRKFHPEEEFQKMQKATLDWIKKNKEEKHNKKDALNSDTAVAESE
jgi:hypothetical protein